MIVPRTEIKAALDTVADVTGYAYRPTAPREFDAWPVLGALEHADGMAFYVTWRVLLLLPNDERAASYWVDGHAEALIEALTEVGYVDRLEPVLIPGEGGDRPGLQVEMRGE